MQVLVCDNSTTRVYVNGLTFKAYTLYTIYYTTKRLYGYIAVKKEKKRLYYTYIRPLYITTRI